MAAAQETAMVVPNGSGLEMQNRSSVSPNSAVDTAPLAGSSQGSRPATAVDGVVPNKQGVAKPASPQGKQIPIPCGLNRYVLAFLFCIVVLMKGCTYWGWNGMQDMLYKSGAYSWECSVDSAGAGVIVIGDIEYPDCPGRKNMINNLYTATFSAHFISSAISGVLLDAAGPKICMLSAIAVEAAGWLLIGFSSESFQGYYAGGVFLGVAADPGYLPLLSMANLFPGNQSFIMAVLGSLRSISFAVPVVMSAIYQGDGFGENDFWKIVVFYVAVCLGLATCISLFTVPMHVFKPQSELVQEAASDEKQDDDSPKRRTSYTGPMLPAGADVASELKEMCHDLSEEVPGRPHEAESAGSKTPETAAGSFVSTLKSKEFLLIVPCFVIALLRAEFYTKSNKEQLQVSTTSNVYQMFSVLNIMSFLPGPVFGKMADKFGILPVITILNGCGILLYIFVMPNVIACKAISTVIYFIYCSFVLSNLYCYVAINFPSEYFGKLTGLASLIGGVFSLTSIGWYKLSSETLIDLEPYNFLPADGVMVFLGIVNCFIILAMFREAKKKREAANDRSSLLDVSGKEPADEDPRAPSPEVAV
ncbi:transporter, major facilitator family protein [Toxoplasma gondii FOU]|uniref:Transporter, major facilitator family protein n=1 Tax=Toxoplasma gondii FOU TaxID=943167 RepID=A0A086KGI9_TOXGO|nr:transporter, major facilitator family protein [Toxoplasma gondii FOU]